MLDQTGTKKRVPFSFIDLLSPTINAHNDIYKLLNDVVPEPAVWSHKMS